jgi:hypothetical protein
LSIFVSEFLSKCRQTTGAPTIAKRLSSGVWCVYILGEQILLQAPCVANRELLFANPTQGFRMARIAALAFVFGQNIPQSMQFAVLRE